MKVDAKGFSVLPLIVALVLLSLGVYIGYDIAKKSSIDSQPTIVVATPEPLKEVRTNYDALIKQANSTPIPTTAPTVAPIVNPSFQPSIASKSIIPANWKTYTVDDWDFLVRTTVSLPPGFLFELTYGWTFRFINSETGEEWQHTTSIIRGEDSEEVKNYYDGSSRRVWYQKKLGTEAKFTKIEEHPVENGSTYLKILVHYDNWGNPRDEVHYVYVENGIFHMVTSLGPKALSNDAELPKVMDKVFYSLSSSRYKNK